jgi:hypothetical protein
MGEARRQEQERGRIAKGRPCEHGRRPDCLAAIGSGEGFDNFATHSLEGCFLGLLLLLEEIHNMKVGLLPRMISKDPGQFVESLSAWLVDGIFFCPCERPRIQIAQQRRFRSIETHCLTEVFKPPREGFLFVLGEEKRSGGGGRASVVINGRRCGTRELAGFRDGSPAVS